jgi:hypothetical protein
MIFVIEASFKLTKKKQRSEDGLQVCFFVHCRSSTAFNEKPSLHRATGQLDQGFDRTRTLKNIRQL